MICIVGLIVAAILSEKQNLTVAKKNTSIIDGIYPILDLTKFWNIVVFFTVCGLILCLAYTGGSPFIYGNF